MVNSPLAVPVPTTDSTPPVRQHVAYLDGMRALAALFVVFYHYQLYMQSIGLNLPGILDKINHLLSFGHYAVDVFIVLSGFCLAMPVVRGNGHLAGGAWTFFGKRARRILPPYFLALGFALAVIWLTSGNVTRTASELLPGVTGKDLLTHLLLIQDVFRDTRWTINGVMWSVSVEWRIYFVFPLLMLLRRFWGSAWVAVAAAAVSYLILYVGTHTALGSVFYFGLCGITPQYLGLFAIGLLAADVAYGRASFSPLRQPRVGLVLLAVATALMIAVSKMRVWHGDILPVAYTDLMVGLWAASLLLVASNAQTNLLTQALSWRPLVFLGTFAYSIYLIHAPLIQVLWQYVFVPLQNRPVPMFLALSLVGTPLIVGVSYLFFLCCERPFLNRRKRETMAETERDAALSPAP